MSTFDLAFEPTHQAATRVRQQVRRFFEDVALSSQVSADVELIIAELMSNAVAQAPAEPIRLKVEIGAVSVEVTVANVGPGFELHHTPAPGLATDVLSDRGRGLGIVDALVESLTVEQAHGWTSVRCLHGFEPGTDNTTLPASAGTSSGPGDPPSVLDAKLRSQTGDVEQPAHRLTGLDD